MSTRNLHVAALAIFASLPCVAQPTVGPKAADTCEAAVAETIKQMRGTAAQDVQFIKERRSFLPGASGDTDVKGAGRYRAANGSSMPFTYGCAYNAESDSTSGIVFRDTASLRTSPPKAWQPDLSAVSPENCETAVAAALKSKHPRVARIAFSSDSRQVHPAINGLISLEGIGALERAPGMNANPFKYRCEFNPGHSKVTRVETTE